MLHASFPCKVIHSREYGNGTLYAIMLSRPTAHRTLDNRITELDGTLMRGGGGSTSTRFTSVSDVLGGKIKTFAAGEHMIDEHYKAIFESDHPGGGREPVVHPGVLSWIPPRKQRRVHGVDDGRREDDAPEELTVEEKAKLYRDKLVQQALTRFNICKRKARESATAKVILCFIVYLMSIC
jgi:hypothetical protein